MYNNTGCFRGIALNCFYCYTDCLAVMWKGAFQMHNNESYFRGIALNCLLIVN